MNDDLRNRWKAVKSSNDIEDIASIWDDQKRMRAEDLRLEQEMQAAKKRARELKKTIYKNKFGETKKSSKSVVDKVANKTKQYFNTAKKIVLINKKPALAVSVGVVVFAAGLFASNSLNRDETGTLGESTSDQAFVQNDLPRETPAFPLLYPSNKSSENYEVVRISPPEAAASYAYIDSFSDQSQVFRVTQQEIPEAFSLEETATSFQATSIIQVDDSRIFHGFSEQGGVQSLIFTKNDKLVLIRSPQKFSDDQWAAYISSLR